jgi:imidazolonepropionase-like amidohydrolase
VQVNLIGAAVTRLLFENASILDPDAEHLVPDQSVLVQNETIVEVGTRGDVGVVGVDRVVDIGGGVLMPGLIDCHVHVSAVTADLAQQSEWSPFYVAVRAAEIMCGMLERGFTTVRDVGGGDFGLARAADEGVFDGPRLIFGGRALSQTGGHGDGRGRGRTAQEPGYSYQSMSMVCDGVAEVRRTVREEIKRGAHHIKLMLSGGVASPTDRVDSTQFSLEEIRAAVEEAEAANIYVTGHAYTARAINRGLECGVRCIEHGNLMDASSPPLFLKHAAFYVPTLVTYSALAEHGRESGLPAASYAKVFDVLDAGLHALEMADRAGVPIAYGTDLLGAMHAWQSREFKIRSEVQGPGSIIRAATSIAARLLRMEGQIGTIAPGAYADLLVVDANPLEDINVLAEPHAHIRKLVKAGRVIIDR